MGSLLVRTLKHFKSEKKSTKVSDEGRHEIYEKLVEKAANTQKQIREEREKVEDEHRGQFCMSKTHQLKESGYTKSHQQQFHPQYNRRPIHLKTSTRTSFMKQEGQDSSRIVIQNNQYIYSRASQVTLLAQTIIKFFHICIIQSEF